jgi:hypothetical protein
VVAQRVAWSARCRNARLKLQEQQVADMQWAEEERSAADGRHDDPARLAQQPAGSLSPAG